MNEFLYYALNILWTWIDWIVGRGGRGGLCLLCDDWNDSEVDVVGACSCCCDVLGGRDDERCLIGRCDGDDDDECFQGEEGSDGGDDEERLRGFDVTACKLFWIARDDCELRWIGGSNVNWNEDDDERFGE